MNIDSSWLVAPIIGAIIGCFTNWLAIKMIFRPYNEKRIFGIKIPFTPGIMPKRRYILAKKVGDAVSEYVLTEKAINDELTSNEAIASIKKNIDDILEDTKKSDKTVDEFLVMLLNDKKHDFVLASEKILQNGVSNILKSQYLKDEINNFIFANIEKFLKYDNPSNILTNFIEEHKEEIALNFNEFLQSTEFKELSGKGISDIISILKETEDSFSKYVPDEAVICLKENIAKILPSLPHRMITFLADNPEIDQKLDKMVQKIANDNVNKMALMFVNKEKIYMSIKTELIAYLSDPINQADINEKVSLEIDNFLNRNIKEFSSKIPNDLENSLKDNFQNVLEKINNEKYMEIFIDAFLEKISKEHSYNLYDILIKYFPDFISKMQISLQEIISNFLNGKAIFMVNKILDNYKNKFLNKKVCTFFENMSDLEIENLKTNILEIADFVFLKGANYVSKSINISRVVEVQVNEFDLETAEDIIQSVINKELKAITYFGGILGFMIGLITVVFQGIVIH